MLLTMIFVTWMILISGGVIWCIAGVKALTRVCDMTLDMILILKTKEKMDKKDE